MADIFNKFIIYTDTDGVDKILMARVTYHIEIAEGNGIPVSSVKSGGWFVTKRDTENNMIWNELILMGGSDRFGDFDREEIKQILDDNELYTRPDKRVTERVQIKRVTVLDN